MSKSLKNKRNYGKIDTIKGLMTPPKESHNGDTDHHESVVALVKTLAQRTAEEHFRVTEEAHRLPEKLQDGIEI